MMAMKKLALVPFLGILFTGCLMGPDYVRPPVTTPEQYYMAQGPAEAKSLADLPWWEVFDDPLLKSLVDEALITFRVYWLSHRALFAPCSLFGHFAILNPAMCGMAQHGLVTRGTKAFMIMRTGALTFFTVQLREVDAVKERRIVQVRRKLRSQTAE